MRNGSRTYVPVLVTALMLLVAASGARADSTWQLNLNVAEGATNLDLTWGVDPTATTGIDAALSEVEQPPLPPSGNFDARWAESGIGNGLLVDIVPGTAPQAEQTLKLAVQTAAGGDFTVTWDASAVAGYVTSAHLQDTFGGVILDVDMTAQNSVTTNVSPLNLVFTSKDGIAPPVQWTQMSISQQPTTATSSVAMTPALKVAVTDGSGNPANTTDPTLTVALASGSGTLSGTLTAHADASTGIVTFDDLVYTGSTDGETITLQVTGNAYDGSAMTPLTTSNITVSRQPAPVLTPVPAAVAHTQENQTPLLTWSTVSVADSYLLDLGVAPGCESVLNDVAVVGTSYQAPRLTDGSYCWRVASVMNGNAVWSSDSTFDTIPTFGEWGLIFTIASMIGFGAWYLRRRTRLA